jgi:hypothetical protein
MRAGRKRAGGLAPRYANGNLRPSRDLDVEAIAGAHPDRRGLSPSLRLHQKAGTPIGRMNLAGLITDQQLEAARLYAAVVRRFHQVVNAPRYDPPSLNLGGAGGQGRSLVAFEAEEVERRREAYDSAWGALCRAGRRALICVNRVACYDEPIPAHASFSDLSTGLSALVTHYGLTGRRKSGERGYG